MGSSQCILKRYDHMWLVDLTHACNFRSFAGKVKKNSSGRQEEFQQHWVVALTNSKLEISLKMRPIYIEHIVSNRADTFQQSNALVRMVVKFNNVHRSLILKPLSDKLKSDVSYWIFPNDFIVDNNLLLHPFRVFLLFYLP